MNGEGQESEVRRRKSGDEWQVTSDEQEDRRGSSRELVEEDVAVGPGRGDRPTRDAASSVAKTIRRLRSGEWLHTLLIDK